ncbi:hypothetical protein Ecaj_0732 [Ehrlichia canis str. Jake]|uniref:Uncharacterized protein n=1 Tax=Ehrlichia canis (strain Jake) TaxID=269484 RepID=A0ACA6AWB3_EHRCJ|nr:hypothetical protein Ecaj_0732 [Ehrlichia canis str. Jake]
MVMNDYDSVILGFFILFIVLTIIMFCTCCVFCTRSVLYDRLIESEIKKYKDVEEQESNSLGWTGIFVNRMRDTKWSINKDGIRSTLIRQLELQGPLRNQVINPDGNRNDIGLN